MAVIPDYVRLRNDEKLPEGPGNLQIAKEILQPIVIPPDLSSPAPCLRLNAWQSAKPLYRGAW